jgi:hypothetical protein
MFVSTLVSSAADSIDFLVDAGRQCVGECSNCRRDPRLGDYLPAGASCTIGTFVWRWRRSAGSCRDSP